jgi:D-alanyl-D-alanine carboxypeptidase
VHAYGNARIEPLTPANPGMRYSIGPISKQFTAAAILLLQEQGKLSFDDEVGRCIPGLCRANEVIIRQLLSRTSGYQDYWPQDYVTPRMLQLVTGQKILDTGARKPLHFKPGTKWHYSNTNFVIAGLIVDKAGGEPLLQSLQERALTCVVRSARRVPRQSKEAAGAFPQANWPCPRRTWQNGKFPSSMRNR